MRQIPINFKSKQFDLEGVISTTEISTVSLPGVILCHPHPVFGGTMDNPVIMALVQGLNRSGIASLRFNFRGVGNSGGDFSNGEEVVEDLEAGVDLLRGWPGVDNKRLALVGYSFGGQVIASGLPRYKRIKALVLISPPTRFIGTGSVLSADIRPKLIMVGNRDRLVMHLKLADQIATFKVPPTFTVIEGADHSWARHEATVAEEVTRFLELVL